MTATQHSNTDLGRLRPKQPMVPKEDLAAMSTKDKDVSLQALVREWLRTSEALERKSRPAGDDSPLLPTWTPPKEDPLVGVTALITVQLPPFLGVAGNPSLDPRVGSPCSSTRGPPRRTRRMRCSTRWPTRARSASLARTATGPPRGTRVVARTAAPARDPALPPLRPRPGQASPGRAHHRRRGPRPRGRRGRRRPRRRPRLTASAHGPTQRLRHPGHRLRHQRRPARRAGALPRVRGPLGRVRRRQREQAPRLALNPP